MLPTLQLPGAIVSGSIAVALTLVSATVPKNDAIDLATPMDAKALIAKIRTDPATRLMAAMRTNELFDLDDFDMKLLPSGCCVCRGHASALSDAGPPLFPACAAS